ncbi:MAG: DNA mismatch repair protein MutS [Spirochaetaceae bacterium]|nr:DNA mismatch repair protein MutS [Spirochaetaceae bacterium]
MRERSAMLDQYRRIKAKYRDVILFFRLGDFYEMFFDDAIEVSALLDLTLTKRQGQPMCGIPYHAAKPYIARLLKAGKKVAICEQLTAPKAGSLVDRDVIEVVTPGTTIEEEFLDQSANNYLVCACCLQGRLCLASLDVSTAEFRAYSHADDAGAGTDFLRSELYRFSPREIIIQQSLCERQGFAELLREFDSALIQREPDWSFDVQRSFEHLKEHFRVASLKGFGFADDAPELAAAGVVLDYVTENSRTKSPHIQALLPYDQDEFLSLDEATRKNLELVRNLADSGRRDTLLSVLDRTKTAGGHRLLQQWMLQALRRKDKIEERLDIVDCFYKDQLLLNELRRRLGGVLDSERLVARLAMDKAHAKDLLALRDSLKASLGVLELVRKSKVPLQSYQIADGEDEEACRKVIGVIDSAIREDPSILLTEGNMIHDGYSQELDRLRMLKKNSTQVLDQYLEEEKATSGISSLRIRYNKIIGYYLEVTKGKLDAVPAHFIRRQSLVGGERYTTDRLAQLESEINGATEKIIDLEKQLFLSVRESLKIYIAGMEHLAAMMARLDCLASFAQAATEAGFCRPQLSEDSIIDIHQGRHPVVEACLPAGAFVPNDIVLDTKGQFFALITGPNMAGKSTVLRQTALIVLMAHMGSFVPAESALIGLVDRIFCRVGAQDNLARGESTFLVEMHETAYILNTATSKSLVIMDEVGRGTGTLDGVSIAWAISEYILERIRCRTLFATHYHELTSMENPNLVNMSMAVLENQGEIVFLKQLKKGPAAGSYGIHVAGLAGIPAEVLQNARNLQGKMMKFEQSLTAAAGSAAGHTDLSSAFSAPASTGGSAQPDEKPQPARAALELFPVEDIALAKIRSADINRMTPLQAMQFLADISEMLKQGS